jgi:hypothetical protein
MTIGSGALMEAASADVETARDWRATAQAII